MTDDSFSTCPEQTIQALFEVLFPGSTDHEEVEVFDSGNVSNWGVASAVVEAAWLEWAAKYFPKCNLQT